MKTKTFWFSSILVFLVSSALLQTSNAYPSSQAKQSAQVGTRTFTFVNNCSYPVWIGMSGGSTASITGKQCVQNSDCPTGSSCVQTGNITQCFWNNPVPSDGDYQLSANGGTKQIAVPMYTDTGAVWS